LRKPEEAGKRSARRSQGVGGETVTRLHKMEGWERKNLEEEQKKRGGGKRDPPEAKKKTARGMTENTPDGGVGAATRR